MDNKSTYLVPISIMVAGALIGGGLAFGLSNSGTAGMVQEDQGGEPQISLEELLPQLIDEVGLDSDKFASCYEDNKYNDRIAADVADASTAGGNGTPYTVVIDQKGRKVPIPGALPYSNVKALVDAMLKDDPEVAATAKDIQIKEVTSSDHVRGNVNAPITLIEFSDFDCPFCKRFHPTMTQLLDEYPDKVRWVYRHLPLTDLHPNAAKKALASECAAEQGKFWEFADRLIET